jgi:hypothetical protein
MDNQFDDFENDYSGTTTTTDRQSSVNTFQFKLEDIEEDRSTIYTEDEQQDEKRDFWSLFT